MTPISKDDAIAAGLDLYFTGRPCARGGIGARRVSSGACVCSLCREFRRNKKAAQDQDKTRKYARESARKQRALNRDAWLAEKRAWRNKNAEADRERKRLYRQQNPHVNQAHGARYRARKAKAAPAWDREFDNLVMREAAHLCHLRKAATGVRWQIDHMIPLKAIEACGLHVGVNIQVIPAWINNAKNNRMILTEPGDWLR